MAMFSDAVQFGHPTISRRTIRILVYVDHRQSTMKPVPPKPVGQQLRGIDHLEFGVRILKDLVESQSNFLIGFKVDVLNRHHDYGPDGAVLDYEGPGQVGKHKLTKALLSRYHQVWFMGQLLANCYVDPASTNEDDREVLRNYGNQEAELTDDEVNALRDWMDDGGGVLMTGDHSNPLQYSGKNYTGYIVDASLRAHDLNLGRALGWRVPRAGQMRVWIDGPGASGNKPSQVVDTSNDSNMSSMSKQEDGTPQTIRVARVPRFLHASPKASGVTVSPSFVLDYHPLFKATPSKDFPTSVIDILPDHAHEGAVLAPQKLDPRDWPTVNGYQEAPQIVAWGRNWTGFREPTLDLKDGTVAMKGAFQPPECGLVAAYDGDAVGVGRIVAHSTWHHMVNVNLIGFVKPDGTPGPVLERLGTYFANLAMWLSPQVVRAHAAIDLSKWVLDHPVVREVKPGPMPLLGATMYQVMSRAIGEGPLADMLDMPLRAAMRTMTAAGAVSNAGGLPAEWFLGALAHTLHASPEALANEPEGPKFLQQAQQILCQAAAAATSAYRNELSNAVRQLSALEETLMTGRPGASSAEAS